MKQGRRFLLIAYFDISGTISLFPQCWASIILINSSQVQKFVHYLPLLLKLSFEFGHPPGDPLCRLA